MNNDITWELQRTQGIKERKLLTSVIKQFVSYAESQGSTHAKHYYKHFTHMVKQITGITKQRDELTKEQLRILAICEQQLALKLIRYMNLQLDYHECFELSIQETQQITDDLTIAQTLQLLK